MKKFIVALLTLAMLFSLTACGAKPASPAETPEPEIEQQTVFDFGAYAVEYTGAELLEADYGGDCIMLTLAYTNIDEAETGNFNDNITCTATQNGVELSSTLLNKYTENERGDVNSGEIVDFHKGFSLEYQYNYVYYDVSEIEVVLQDNNSDLSYSFIVDPSDLDDSALSGSTSMEPSTTDGYGDFESILVPNSFELKLDTWKENNPHFVSISNCSWTYFNFRNYTDEEYMKEDYEYLKESYTNDQIDVSANYGGIEWTGFQYYDNDSYNFVVYTVIGDNYLKVESCGFMFDDAVTQAILGSVVMAQ